MKARRKIIVYIATSADGYIARPDGDVEWLNRRPRNVDYGMRVFYSTIDTILWGRKTYDWLLDYHKDRGSKGGMFDTKLANYVFSRKAPKRKTPGAKFVSEPVKAFAQRLRATPGKHIWMMGGGKLIASFLDAGEIDEFDIHVIPTFIGEGIPLVAPRHRDVPLRLRSARKYPDGVVRLRYQVTRGSLTTLVSLGASNFPLLHVQRKICDERINNQHIAGLETDNTRFAIPLLRKTDHRSWVRGALQLTAAARPVQFFGRFS